MLCLVPKQGRRNFTCRYRWLLVKKLGLYGEGRGPRYTPQLDYKSNIRKWKPRSYRFAIFCAK